MTGADIGLCIPTYNERATIGPVLEGISKSLAGARYTVCVVDDGSSDGTAEIVEERSRQDSRIALLKRRKVGPGCRRGAASRAGMDWLLGNTSHSFLCDFDADGSNRPEELLQGAKLVSGKGVDVVIASRYISGALVEGRPWIRIAGSRIYNLALRALMDWRIRDYSTSFRIYRRSAAALLQGFVPLYDTPTYLIEMMAIWLSHGLRIIEIPTVYDERRSGASKVIPMDFLRGAAGCLRVGLAYRVGRFRPR